MSNPDNAEIQLQARVRIFQEKRGKRDFVITRDDRLFDALDPESHSVIQIARSYSSDMLGHWRVWDTQQQIVAEFERTVK